MVMQMTPDKLGVRKRLHWPANPGNLMKSPSKKDTNSMYAARSLRIITWGLAE